MTDNQTLIKDIQLKLKKLDQLTLLQCLAPVSTLKNSGSALPPSAGVRGGIHA